MCRKKPSRAVVDDSISDWKGEKKNEKVKQKSIVFLFFDFASNKRTVPIATDETRSLEPTVELLNRKRNKELLVGLH